jgi:serine/threonine-protein kinase RsbW
MCNQVMPGCVAPARLRACAFSFPGCRDQVRYARAFVARFLDGHPAADDVVLLISELAANACAHSDSGRPGGSYTVRIQVREGGRVHAEVEDQGSRWKGSFAEIESPHGLFLVRSLAAQCGTRPGARGWVTWFVLGRP